MSDAIARTTRAHIRSARDPRHTLCWINAPFATSVGDESEPCKQCFDVAHALNVQARLDRAQGESRRTCPALLNPLLRPVTSR